MTISNYFGLALNTSRKAIQSAPFLRQKAEIFNIAVIKKGANELSIQNQQFESQATDRILPELTDSQYRQVILRAVQIHLIF